MRTFFASQCPYKYQKIQRAKTENAAENAIRDFFVDVTLAGHTPRNAIFLRRETLSCLLSSKKAFRDSTTNYIYHNLYSTSIW